MDTTRRRDLFVPCECLSHEHILALTYWPRQPDETEEDWPLEIYASVNPYNFYDAILPPIIDGFRWQLWGKFFSSYLWKASLWKKFFCHHIRNKELWKYFFEECLIDKWSWDGFVRFNFLKRFYVALRYLLNAEYVHKMTLGSGICEYDYLDSFREFMGQIAKPGLCHIDESTDVWMEGIAFDLRFTIDRHDETLPYEFGWELQFSRKKKLWKRIIHTWKYIWGIGYNETGVSISSEEAAVLRDMAHWVQRKNKELHDSPNS